MESMMVWRLGEKVISKRITIKELVQLTQQHHQLQMETFNEIMKQIDNERSKREELEKEIKLISQLVSELSNNSQLEERLQSFEEAMRLTTFNNLLAYMENQLAEGIDFSHTLEPNWVLKGYQAYEKVCQKNKQLDLVGNETIQMFRELANRWLTSNDTSLFLKQTTVTDLMNWSKVNSSEESVKGFLRFLKRKSVRKKLTDLLLVSNQTSLDLLEKLETINFHQELTKYSKEVKGPSIAALTNRLYTIIFSDSFTAITSRPTLNKVAKLFGIVETDNESFESLQMKVRKMSDTSLQQLGLDSKISRYGKAVLPLYIWEQAKAENRAREKK